ncbi:GLUG motif-containing protein [Planctomycetota bacterium]
MKRLIVNLVSIVLILGMVETAAGFSGSGSGTEPDPYIITDPCQLQEMQYSLNAWYKLGNDIDAYETETWNAGEGFVPVGDNAHPFVGHLQGNGFAISGLYIYRIGTNYVGLFGKIGSNATIDNVTLADPNITGNDYTGSLAGYSDISPANSHCSGGYVKGHNYAGGLAGYIDNSVSDCDSLLIAVYGNVRVGGLAGYSGSVDNCVSSGLVNGHEFLGGLMGEVNGSIGGAHSQVSILGTGDFCGGLAGYHRDGAATNCYATGSVTGASQVGGLFGQNYHSAITNCYAEGDVTGNADSAYYGGLVGAQCGDDISSCHAAGNVNGYDGVGGLVGYVDNNYGLSNISNCYSTGEVTGSGSDVGGLIGLQHRGSSSINDCYSTHAVYGSGNNVGGLVGRFNNGTISDCYGLGSIGSGGTSVGGVVGYSAASISRCYCNSGVVEGSSIVGGLVGDNRGSISQCYSVSDVNSLGNDAGGLIGYNNGSVENSYAQGNVNGAGYDYVGGFAGENGSNGDISKCYSTGAVIGAYNIGGFVGWNSGTCSYNYWDIETSEQPTSPCATEKTTEEMMQQATFEPEWDFEAVWGIEEGLTYPVLVTISHIPTCGDPWHPYPVGDFNHDCHVDFVDFATFALHWLECTDPCCP